MNKKIYKIGMVADENKENFSQQRNPVKNTMYEITNQQNSCVSTAHEFPLESIEQLAPSSQIGNVTSPLTSCSVIITDNMNREFQEGVILTKKRHEPMGSEIVENFTKASIFDSECSSLSNNKTNETKCFLSKDILGSKSEHILRLIRPPLIGQLADIQPPVASTKETENITITPFHYKPEDFRDSLSYRVERLLGKKVMSRCSQLESIEQQRSLDAGTHKLESSQDSILCQNPMLSIKSNTSGNNIHMNSAHVTTHTSNDPLGQTIRKLCRTGENDSNIKISNPSSKVEKHELERNSKIADKSEINPFMSQPLNSKTKKCDLKSFVSKYEDASYFQTEDTDYSCIFSNDNVSFCTNDDANMSLRYNSHSSVGYKTQLFAKKVLPSWKVGVDLPSTYRNIESIEIQTEDYLQESNTTDLSDQVSTSNMQASLNTSDVSTGEVNTCSKQLQASGSNMNSLITSNDDFCQSISYNEHRISPTSVSSLTSNKPLEWDYGADIGYAAACRTEPEGFSVLNSVSNYKGNTKNVGINTFANFSAFKYISLPKQSSITNNITNSEDLLTIESDLIEASDDTDVSSSHGKLSLNSSSYNLSTINTYSVTASGSANKEESSYDSTSSTSTVKVKRVEDNPYQKYRILSVSSLPENETEVKGFSDNDNPLPPSANINRYLRLRPVDTANSLWQPMENKLVTKLPLSLQPCYLSTTQELNKCHMFSLNSIESVTSTSKDISDTSSNLNLLGSYDNWSSEREPCEYSGSNISNCSSVVVLDSSNGYQLERKQPSLPIGKLVFVESSSFDHLISANQEENAHIRWYPMNGGSNLQDIKDAATQTSVSYLAEKSVEYDRNFGLYMDNTRFYNDNIDFPVHIESDKNSKINEQVIHPSISNKEINHTIVSCSSGYANCHVSEKRGIEATQKTSSASEHTVLDLLNPVCRLKHKFCNSAVCSFFDTAPEKNDQIHSSDEVSEMKDTTSMNETHIMHIQLPAKEIRNILPPVENLGVAKEIVPHVQNTIQNCLEGSLQDELQTFIGNLIIPNLEISESSMPAEIQSFNDEPISAFKEISDVSVNSSTCVASEDFETSVSKNESQEDSDLNEQNRKDSHNGNRTYSFTYQKGHTNSTQFKNIGFVNGSPIYMLKTTSKDIPTVNLSTASIYSPDQDEKICSRSISIKSQGIGVAPNSKHLYKKTTDKKKTIDIQTSQPLTFSGQHSSEYRHSLSTADNSCYADPEGEFKNSTMSCNTINLNLVSNSEKEALSQYCKKVKGKISKIEREIDTKFKVTERSTAKNNGTTVKNESFRMLKNKGNNIHSSTKIPINYNESTRIKRKRTNYRLKRKSIKRGDHDETDSDDFKTLQQICQRQYKNHSKKIEREEELLDTLHTIIYRHIRKKPSTPNSDDALSQVQHRCTSTTSSISKFTGLHLSSQLSSSCEYSGHVSTSDVYEIIHQRPKESVKDSVKLTVKKKSGHLERNSNQLNLLDGTEKHQCAKTCANSKDQKKNSESSFLKEIPKGDQLETVTNKKTQKTPRSPVDISNRISPVLLHEDEIQLSSLKNSTNDLKFNQSSNNALDFQTLQVKNIVLSSQMKNEGRALINADASHLHNIERTSVVHEICEVKTTSTNSSVSVEKSHSCSAYENENVPVVSKTYISDNIVNDSHSISNVTTISLSCCNVQKILCQQEQKPISWIVPCGELESLERQQCSLQGAFYQQCRNTRKKIETRKKLLTMIEGTRVPLTERNDNVHVQNESGNPSERRSTYQPIDVSLSSKKISHLSGEDLMLKRKLYLKKLKRLTLRNPEQPRKNELAELTKMYKRNRDQRKIFSKSLATKVVHGHVNWKRFELVVDSHSGS